ncbi:MAG TPA: CHASE2 domain-containing protein, partial [Bacillota bacterium]|nr:CHASE2 domain-containing protein [Bacillota bacterium]
MKNLGSFKKYIPIFLLCLIIGFFAYVDIFTTLDSKLQDRFLRKTSPIDTEIVLVSIDDQSLEDLGRFPWPRYVHAELIRILSQGKPAAIGIDLIFSEAAEDPEEDQAFVEAIREAGNVILPVYANLEGFSDRRGAIKTDNLVIPLPDYPDRFNTGHINTFPDRDGIIRKTALYLDYQGEAVPSFAWRIYEKYCRSNGLPV